MLDMKKWLISKFYNYEVGVRTLPSWGSKSKIKRFREKRDAEIHVEANMFCTSCRRPFGMKEVILENNFDNYVLRWWNCKNCNLAKEIYIKALEN